MKRQHSAEPFASVFGNTDTSRTSESHTPVSVSTPPATGRQATTPPQSDLPRQETNLNFLDSEAYIGSPLKKQRASISGVDDEVLRKRMGSGLSTGAHNILRDNGASMGNLSGAFTGMANTAQKPSDEEEL